MKFIRLRYIPVTVLALALGLSACKTKKVMQKPPGPPGPPQTKVVLPVKDKPNNDVAASTVAVAPLVLKPDYNFTNLQFEFNSAILKTSSYPMLDKVAMEMKKDASVKFNLSGYASAEGTPEHNMELSEQRASAVKIYLLNAGVTESQMSSKGYGEGNPIKPNTTEDNRALNRRVEIKKN
ncbi:MAG: OmpA family protein [Mucilaginibacter sp.]|uniref:OmpA family protein n=1 Tax=Mucilaginibacter sp. TaxID=1882438 RepID=UPI0032679B93